MVERSPETADADTALNVGMAGCCYAVLALALLIVEARRHRARSQALERGEPAPLTATTVTLFTVGAWFLRR